jgi:ribonuclease HI
MYLIYADGACNLKTPLRAGGFGFVAYNQFKEVFTCSKGYNYTTNNRMEIRAVIEAIRWYDSLFTREGLKVFSDSKYVVDMWNSWIDLWQRRPKKDLKNVDLVNEMILLKEKHPNLALTWVKGHNGDLGNERADLLAKEALESKNRIVDVEEKTSLKYPSVQRVNLDRMVSSLFS